MRRQAFTLVEMMVSIALVLFIMVILSQAFQAGIASFRYLKSIGDMDDRMRAAATLLRRDLAADHFEGKRRISDESFWTHGPPREGFFRVWHSTPATLEGADGDGLPSTRATNHTLHFSVKLRGNQPQDFVSATAPFNTAVPSTFFIQAPDARYQGQGEYRSQWFEVVYYLRQTGTTLVPDSPEGGPGTPLFALMRRQVVAVPDNTRLNWTNQQLVHNANELSLYSEMSCKKKVLGVEPQQNPYSGGSDSLYFNNPTDLTVPARRFGMLPRSTPLNQQELAGLPGVPLENPNQAGMTPNYKRVYPMLGEMIYQGRIFRNLSAAQQPRWYTKWNGGLPSSLMVSQGGASRGLPPVWQDNPSQQGADMLLTDVLSFEVKVLTPGVSDFTDLFDPVVPQTNPVFSGAGHPRVFDTWSSVKDDTYDYSNWAVPGTPASAPAQIRIQALQITLRVWDPKTQQTRQITLVQDM